LTCPSVRQPVRLQWDPGRGRSVPEEDGSGTDLFVRRRERARERGWGEEEDEQEGSVGRVATAHRTETGPSVGPSPSVLREALRGPLGSERRRGTRWLTPSLQAHLSVDGSFSRHAGTTPTQQQTDGDRACLRVRTVSTSVCPLSKSKATRFFKKKKSQKQRTGAGEGTDAVFLCPVLPPDPTGVSTVALEQE
jgi:hypothetical protein